MKASNKDVWKNFRVERIPVPGKYRTKQHDHDSYIWESQDGRFVPIKKFDDNHLQNTYRMLVNTILYAKEMDKHKALTSQMRRIVTACSYHLHYIGYELHCRQAPEKQKYKMSNNSLP